jgi:hypothetical protein
VAGGLEDRGQLVGREEHLGQRHDPRALDAARSTRPRPVHVLKDVMALKDLAYADGDLVVHLASLGRSSDTGFLPVQADPAQNFLSAKEFQVNPFYGRFHMVRRRRTTR